nr:hypothetical protein [Cereibacter sphaeroides]
MAPPRPDNLHSRLVSWLKVVLPLAALAILSTLFLVARTINPDDAIPYADVDVADRVREPRITAPTWAGITSDGAALSVEAAAARPGQAPGEEGDPICSGRAATGARRVARIRAAVGQARPAALAQGA